MIFKLCYFTTTKPSILPYGSEIFIWQPSCYVPPLFNARIWHLCQDFEQLLYSVIETSIQKATEQAINPS
jgi:hypothetical protein